MHQREDDARLMEIPETHGLLEEEQDGLQQRLEHQERYRKSG